ncbi:MAG: PIN domain-containing protein [bacterium]
MKDSVYLDTTIFSYLFEKRESIKTYADVTREWWEFQRRKYNLYISIETLAELQEGNYPYKEEAERLAETIELLPRIKEIEEIAEIYVKNFVMPKDLEGDAIHLAYASVYKIDFLLTWNCRHLANANKRRHVRQINTKLGLFIPEIITPLELFEEEQQ